MENGKSFTITREKHLDHMVRVVPFIVFCYAVQCFVIMRVSPGNFSTISLSILGGFLALMIAGFITYDVKHQVILNEGSLNIRFLGSDKTILYDDIWLIEINEPGQTFSTMRIQAAQGKVTFYFIDDSEKIKQWIESHQSKTQTKKAA
jgi:hypothetical protein